MATDFSRAQILRSSLQTIADSSALAGASELNQNADPAVSKSSAISIATSYFNKSSALLMDSQVIGIPTVTVPNSNTVKVSVTATLKNTLMSLYVADAPMSVSATAQGPGYALQLTRGPGFTSNAADENDMYFYIVPPGGGRPAIDATASAYTLLFSNNTTKYPTLNSNASVAVGANDKVGFGMYNITGGKSPYPAGTTNAYGGGNNSVHAFFSSIDAPSMDAGQAADYYKFTGYPTQQPTYTATVLNASNKCVKSAITTTTSSQVTTYADPCNAGGYPCVTAVNGTTFQNNLMVGTPGNLKCSTPSTAILTCLQLYETPTTFSWGDMGGYPKDDFDYANADYTVQCVPNTTGTASSGQPAAVILVQ